ncbi:type ISP restriction/modification enzyme [Streptomyces sp. NRRL B-3648]|uniref:type ISP restriction/modification enzyme n=1 Tax=Streptomyces sp. NRRL B-3648 TaxID=1519493 RepID=UPI0006AFCDF9|nr:type ISP restriction/modification enzyme [Streptomyces sp. NRRL B-3648]KOV91214.1 DNA methyltransferase [Streptomyces sp. NRRL B-3648]
MPDVTHDDAPPLADLMPWSVAPLRPGRAWPLAPDAASLRARWDALLRAEGPDRERLFEATRARTLRSAVAQLPGQSTGTERLSRAQGPCAEPVRVLAAAFDEQWLIPDHRLLDAARPELWRVADARQVFTVETGDADNPLLATSHPPVLRSGRVRPLYRRPGGTEPNLAPGLLDHLSARLGARPSASDVLAWILAAVRPDLTVPLTGDPGRWAAGVAAGRRTLWLMLRDGERPKLPGGRRPYVRAPLPSRPVGLRYDRDEESLYLDEGRISPVPPEAWDYEVAGARVLESWFAARTAPAEPGTLAAIRPAAWPQAWTSELLELITVLALLADARAPRAGSEVTAPVTAADLRRAGVLPVPEPSRRPASVLDHLEEGPDGQFALL